LNLTTTYIPSRFIVDIIIDDYGGEMSLDQNLFTLAIAASADESGALDLTDPNTSTIHYRKRFDPPDPENAYSWGLYGS